MPYPKISVVTPPLGAIVLCLLALWLGGCRAVALKSINVVGPEFSGSELLDLSYGQDSRQALDLYLPDRISADGPLLVFVYGGAWQFGHRNQYRWVGRQLAAMGYATAVPDYRLFPHVTFPEFVDDVAQAIPTAIAHCRSSGNCRSGRLILIGHSAGAHTAAMLAMDQRYFQNQEVDVIGWVGLSGPYDFLPLRDKLEEIFPPSVAPELTQPINFASAGDPPALLIHGKDDTRVYPENSQRLAKALKTAGVPVAVQFFSNVRHAAVLLALSGRVYQDLGVRDRIADFIDCLEHSSGQHCL